MERLLFEQIVAEALDALPETFRARLDNVEVVVEDWPDRATLRQAGLRHPAQLLGFSAPINPTTGRFEFPDHDADIVVALCQLNRYLADHVEEPFVMEVAGGRTEW